MIQRLVCFVFLGWIAFEVNGQEPSNAFNGDDLLAASQAEDIARVKAILASGVDVNSQSKYGATSLYFASDRGNVELARVLLEAGADPNLTDRFYNGTPMAFAQMRNHYGVVQCLIEFGAENPESILFSAIGTNNLELAEAVLKSGKVIGQNLALAKTNAEAKGDERWARLFVDLDVPELEVYEPQAEELKRCIGNYEISGTTASVKLDDKQLAFGFGGAPGTKLKPIGKSRFLMGQSVLVFSADGDQAATVTMTMGGNTFTMNRSTAAKSPSNPTPTKTEDVEVKFKSDSVTALKADLAVASKNWPMFRGNGSRGIAEGQRPPIRWNVKANENVRWKFDTEGLGLSCPAIWEGRIYLTSAVSENDSGEFRTGLYGDVDSVEDDSEYAFNVYCVDKANGKLIWEKTAHRAKPAVKRHAKSSHANSTVAVDGKYVVAFFASEGLYCYSVEGDLIWKKDLGILDSGWFYDADYQWGFASSPIIFEDRVIVQCDIQGDSFMAAFALQDGSQIWKVRRDEIPSWSSPVVHRFDDLPMLITYGTTAARGYDARDGQLLWELKGKHSEIVVPTPFVAHDLIFLCSGYRPIRPIFAVRPSARGDITLAEGEESSEHIAWMKPRGGPYLPTPVVYGDYLYTCDNSGILTCYQATSGKQVYRKRMTAPGGRLSFSASVLAADGHLYFSSEDGRVLVVKAGPQYELVSVNQAGENVLATPAISEGVFYLRTQNRLVALESDQD